MGPSDIGDACRPPKGRQREMFWLRHVGGIVVVLVLILCDWKVSPDHHSLPHQH